MTVSPVAGDGQLTGAYHSTIAPAGPPLPAPKDPESRAAPVPLVIRPGCCGARAALAGVCHGQVTKERQSGVPPA